MRYFLISQSARCSTRQARILTCGLLALVVVYGVLAVQGMRILCHGRGRPSVDVDQPVFDFGRIAAGSEVRHTFVVKNVSRKPLAIRKVMSECACTASVVSNKELGPRGESRVEVSMDTSGYMGQMQKKCQVILEPNDVAPVLLVVRAHIFSPTAFFSTNRIYLGEVPSGMTAVKTISVLHKDCLPEGWRIASARCSSDSIQVGWDETEGKVTCTLRGNRPLGPISEYLLLRTEEARGSSEVRIPIEGCVVSPYRLCPARLCLNVVHGQAGPAVKAKIRIESVTGDLPEGFQLSRAEGDLAICFRDRTSLECEIELMVPHDPGFFAGTLRIATNDKRHPELLLPYNGQRVSE